MKTGKLSLAKGMTVSGLAHLAAQMLKDQEGLDVKLLTTMNGAWIVQAHSRNEHILRWIGTGQHLTVTLTPSGTECVTVIASSNRSFYRSALIVTGTFIICWPLAVLAAAGAIRNRLLIHKIFRVLRSHSPPD